MNIKKINNSGRNLLLAIEIISIIFLLLWLLNKVIKQENLSVGMISKSILSKNTDSEFQYFYEISPKNPDYSGYATRLGYNPKILHNEDALNERYNYPIEKTPNTFRIITLGDSWTYGFLVNTEENYSERLENILNERCGSKIKYEVINLGVPGYDVNYAEERFIKRGLKYNPDLILWLIHSDDFSESTEKLMHYYKLLSEKPEYASIKDLPEKTVKIWADVRKKTLEEFSVQKTKDYKSSTFNKIKEGFNGNIIIFTIDKPLMPLSEFAKNIIYSFTESRAKTIYLEKFLSLEKPFLLYDFHPNSKGHKYIAEKIFNELKNTKLLCNK